MSQLFVTPAPHIHSGHRAQMQIWTWNIALAPVVVGAIAAFGWRGLGIILAGAMGSCAGQMAARVWLKRKEWKPDARGVYIGLLTALLLNPSTPVGIVFISSFLGTAVAQEFFGGPGASLFNPALVSWMFARLFTPALVTPVTESALLLSLSREADVSFRLSSLFWGVRSGSLGQASLLMTAAAGAILIFRKAASFVMPAAFLLSLAVFAHYLGLDAKAEIFLGPALMAALFLVTDPETSPSSKAGKFFYACFSGAVFAFIKNAAGDRPEAALYGIILANAVVPWIDQCSSRKITPRKSR